ncbi:hypothetical protein ABPG74_007944 [Tetrahymena malaccensis]
MILTLSNKVKDLNSLLTNLKKESLFKLEINFKNDIFVQKNGMDQFISSLSQFTNLKHLILNLVKYPDTWDAIQSLSQLIQSLQKLESISFKSKTKNISNNEYDYLLSSIGNISNIQNISLAMNYSSQEEHLTIFKYFEQTKSLKNLTFTFSNNQKNILGELQFQYNQIAKLNLIDFLVDQNVIQSLSIILQNAKELENFECQFINSNLSSILLNQLFSLFHSHPNVQKLTFYISQDILLKEFFSLFKHLEQMYSLQRLIFELESGVGFAKNNVSIGYKQYCNKLHLRFKDVQINEKDAQYISNYIKNLGNLEKLKIHFDCAVQASSYNILFQFFKDHKSLRKLILEFQNKKLTSEQCQAVIQSLKQSKSLKKLKIMLLKTQSEKQVYEVLSQQLSQLENIVSLKQQILFEKIDISTLFIDQIVKNEYLQELDINFSRLEYDGDYQVKAQQLFSMKNLKKLRLKFENQNGREIEFFKDLDSVKQTNLQELTISFNQHGVEKFNEKYANLGKCLNNQRLIKSLTIEVNQNNDFESNVILIKEIKSSTMTSFKVDFGNWNDAWFRELIGKLQQYSKRKIKRAVSLKFV